MRGVVTEELRGVRVVHGAWCGVMRYNQGGLLTGDIVSVVLCEDDEADHAHGCNAVGRSQFSH